MVEDILRFFESKRLAIVAALEALPPPENGGREPLERILEFCRGGKMIRGCLVFLGAEAAATQTGGDRDGDLAGLAAAMELFQAGLLVHDDIMDRDETRRGAPTIHAGYAAEARAAGLGDEALHLGESLGICSGDFCYFAAFTALSRALGEHGRGPEIIALCASVLAEVAVAQMDDVRWGTREEEVSEEAILSMYRGKTARYSFSMPLVAGALFAGADELAAPFTELGERLGILFQLRDDEIGLFGSQAATGKGIGSDLREGKKTLFRSRLLAAAPSSELPRLKALFRGTVQARPEDIDYIRVLAEKLGVSRSIREMTERTEKEALAIARALPCLATGRLAILESLVEFVTHREK
jgi:geranylgeranyl diphosphate synthase type I